jgi:hypothetical protein
MIMRPPSPLPSLRISVYLGISVCAQRGGGGGGGGEAVTLQACDSLASSEPKQTNESKTNGAGQVLWSALAGYSDMVALEGDASTAALLIMECGNQSFADQISVARIPHGWVVA